MSLPAGSVFPALILVILLGHVTRVDGGLERVCTPSTKQQQRQGVCGTPLAEVISINCMVYETFRWKRNSGQDALAAKVHPEKKPKPLSWKLQVNLNDTEKSFLHQAKLSKGEALTFITKRSEYHERSLVCECCIFRCTEREMWEYC